MLSKGLLKKTIKDNYKLWAILTAVLMLFMIMMSVMATGNFRGGRDGEAGGGMNVMAADSIIGQYYSMFVIMLLAFYVVLTANKLIAAQVDKGSFSYVMANPVKRNQVSLTQMLYLIGSVALTFVILIITGLIMIAATGIGISIGTFLLLNLGAFLLVAAFAGIAFLASCVFNRSGHSLAVGGGITIAFFLFSMLAGFENFAEFMKLFKYISLNTLFDTAKIIALDIGIIWRFLILAGVAAGCLAGGTVYFKKKDLPL